MRREPSDKSEMTSQVLFGERMQILQENEKWLMVRLEHDQYEGWVDRKQVHFFNQDKESSGMFINSLFEVCLNSKSRKAILPAGSQIFHADSDGFHLGLKQFHLENADVKSDKLADIVLSAEKFLGVPYLWGGRTFMGIDCSGLTQIVMRMIGQSIPRDAYQQAELGTAIAFVEECRTGDLAFFDNAEGRITHVGIVIENSEGSKNIIHASGEVRLDTLDHEGIFNDNSKKYTHHLRLIKRIN